MNEQELLANLRSLNERVGLLEQVFQLEGEAEKEHLKKRLLEHAIREALLQFARETMARAGISEELFLSRFQAAIAWHRDRLLRIGEDMNPNLAAQIDERDPGDVPTEETPPSIYP